MAFSLSFLQTCRRVINPRESLLSPRLKPSLESLCTIGFRSTLIHCMVHVLVVFPTTFEDPIRCCFFICQWRTSKINIHIWSLYISLKQGFHVEPSYINLHWADFPDSFSIIHIGQCWSSAVLSCCHCYTPKCFHSHQTEHLFTVLSALSGSNEM